MMEPDNTNLVWHLRDIIDNAMLTKDGNSGSTPIHFSDADHYNVCMDHLAVEIIKYFEARSE